MYVTPSIYSGPTSVTVTLRTQMIQKDSGSDKGNLLGEIRYITRIICGRLLLVNNG
jgi:hypothetical protein